MSLKAIRIPLKYLRKQGQKNIILFCGTIIHFYKLISNLFFFIFCAFFVYFLTAEQNWTFHKKKIIVLQNNFGRTKVDPPLLCDFSDGLAWVDSYLWINFNFSLLKKSGSCEFFKIYIWVHSSEVRLYILKAQDERNQNITLFFCGNEPFKSYSIFSSNRKTYLLRKSFITLKWFIPLKK